MNKEESQEGDPLTQNDQGQESQASPQGNKKSMLGKREHPSNQAAMEEDKDDSGGEESGEDSESDSNEPAKKVQVRGIGMTRDRRQKTIKQTQVANEAASQSKTVK